VTVAVVGDGPAVDAVRAALGDVDATVESTDVSGVADAALGVVVGVAGAGGFRAANDHALAGDTPLVTVEVGGLGGHPQLACTPASPSSHPTAPASTVSPGGSRRPTSSRPSRRPPTGRRSASGGAHAGRLAADALRGNARPGTVLELPYVERFVAPVPHCDCGDATDDALRRGGEDRSLDEALAAAEPLVDDRVGLLTAVGERESFPAPYYLAAVSDTSGFSDAGPRPSPLVSTSTGTPPT